VAGAETEADVTGKYNGITIWQLL